MAHRERRPRAPRPAAGARRQRGVALIVFLMIAVAASSFVVLRALNSTGAREAARRLATQTALADARRALLGYAAGYADGVHAATKGPGFLPCPDRAGGSPQGAAETAFDCRTSAARETGRLPYHTLGVTEIRDGSGAPLWYAVSEDFRAMSTAMLNPDTATGLRVDARDDVVAVIIAPGPPVAGQVRSAANAYSLAAWLEGENATPGDGRFSALPVGDGNDSVMSITRGQLLAEAQRVVLAEAGHALESYYRDPDGDDDASGADPDCVAAGAAAECDNGMPWLAPRNSTTFQGVVGRGTNSLDHLPLLRLGHSFDASFIGGWTIASAGSYSASGAEPPSEACLRASDCSQAFMVGGVPTVQSFTSPVSGSGVDPWSTGSCTVERAGEPPHEVILACTSSFAFKLGARSLRRTYRFDFASNLRLLPPTASERRSLQLEQRDSWPGALPGAITVTDSEGGTTLGAARLVFASLDAGDLVLLRNVPFDLEALEAGTPVTAVQSPGALPPWLVANDWQHHLFVQYHASLAPGATAAPCAPGSCFTLRVRRAGEAGFVDQTGAAGVVIAGAAALATTTPAQTRPSSAASDHLEGDNAVFLTTRFERRPATDDFNDQLRELRP